MDDLEHQLKQRALTQPSEKLDAKMDGLFFEAAIQSDTRTARRIGPWALVAASLVGVLAGYMLGTYEPPLDIAEPSRTETYIYVIRSDDESGKNIFEISQPPRKFLAEPSEPIITILPMDGANEFSRKSRGDAS